ncbi:hypothetical protein ACFL5K_06010 [Gemmatimonadota bacterium]
MLTRDTDRVLLTFAFLALIPTPPTVIMGIPLLIIWSRHKGNCQVRRD